MRIAIHGQFYNKNLPPSMYWIIDGPGTSLLLKSVGSN